MGKLAKTALAALAATVLAVSAWAEHLSVKFNGGDLATGMMYGVYPVDGSEWKKPSGKTQTDYALSGNTKLTFASSAVWALWRSGISGADAVLDAYLDDGSVDDHGTTITVSGLDTTAFAKYSVVIYMATDTTPSVARHFLSPTVNGQNYTSAFGEVAQVGDANWGSRRVYQRPQLGVNCLLVPGLTATEGENTLTISVPVASNRSQGRACISAIQIVSEEAWKRASRTLSKDEEAWSEGWSPAVPDAVTMVSLGVGDTPKTLTIDDAASVLSLAIAGEGKLTFATDGTDGHMLATETTVVGTDVDATAGVASLGTVTIAEGKTLTLGDASLLSLVEGKGTVELKGVGLSDLRYDSLVAQGGTVRVLNADIAGANGAMLYGHFATAGQFVVDNSTRQDSATSNLIALHNTKASLTVKAGSNVELKLRDFGGWSSFAGDVVKLTLEENATATAEDVGNKGCFAGQLVLKDGVLVTGGTSDNYALDFWQSGSEAVPNILVKEGCTATYAGQLWSNATLYIGAEKGATLNVTAKTKQNDYVKVGEGTVVFSGTSDRPAATITTVKAGTVRIAEGGTVGLGAVVVEEKGRLELEGADSIPAIANALSGAGVVAKVGAGTALLTGDLSGFTGEISVQEGALRVPAGKEGKVTAVAEGATLEVILTEAQQKCDYTATPQSGITVTFVKEDGMVISEGASGNTYTAPLNAWSPKVAEADGTYLWGNAGNWSKGEVPAVEDSVRIDLVEDATLTLGADVSVANLSIAGKGKFTIAGARLAVAGQLTVTGVTLAVPDEGVKPFSYLRLTLSQTQGNAKFGIAEFILTEKGEKVSWPLGTTISDNDNGTEPGWTHNEQVNALIDSVYGDSGAAPKPINPKENTAASYTAPGGYVSEKYNKWMVSPTATAIIHLGQKVTADGYTMWSSDGGDRMPKTWTVEVSNDGSTWWPFDAHSGVLGATTWKAYDYAAQFGNRRMKVKTLSLAEGAGFDLAQGMAPIMANAVVGTGATLYLPEGDLAKSVPFLIAPTAGLTFTFANNADGRYVLHDNGTYLVYTPLTPFNLTATVSGNANWTALPWKDAEGNDIPAGIWDNAAFTPDVTLTFTNKATISYTTRTVGNVTISADSKGVGTLSGSTTNTLTAKTLTVDHNALVNAIAPEKVVIAKDVSLTADIGTGAGDTVWTCPIEGEGTLVKRGSRKLTLKGKVTLPTLVNGYGYSSGSGNIVALEQDYTGAIFFSEAVSDAKDANNDGQSSGGGRVEITSGATLTLTEADVDKYDAVFTGAGDLVLPAGAKLSVRSGSETACFNASALTGTLSVVGAVSATVAEPVAGRTLLKCAVPIAEQAALLNVGADWYAKAEADMGYVLAALPTPAEDTGLEGEALRAVRLVAAKRGLIDGFEVTAKTSAGTALSVTPADVLACFTGLPLEASAEDNSVTVRCDFGIADLRPIENGTALLLKAQVHNGNYAEGIQVEVVSPDIELTDVTPINPPTGEVAEAGVRWFRIPYAQDATAPLRLKVKATKATTP